jgi:hypothetical protein
MIYVLYRMAIRINQRMYGIRAELVREHPE